MPELNCLHTLSAFLLTVLTLAACSSPHEPELPPEPAPAQSAADRTPSLPFFLPREAYPDFKLVLPAPPEEGSSRFEHDKQIYRETRQLKGSQLWLDAATQLSHDTEAMARLFSEPMGVTLSKEQTPRIYYVMQRVRGDMSYGGNKPPKQYYSRQRPFMYFKERSCATEEHEKQISKDGSFPSGHSCYAYLLALILTEINPAQQDKILAAGIRFGDYRVICGVHWQSDVDAGRFVAVYVNARLHADPQFRKALSRAKAEFQALSHTIP